MADELGVWAAAAARAVVKTLERSAGDPFALARAAIYRQQDAAPFVAGLRASRLPDQALVRSTILDGRFPGEPVRQHMSSAGRAAFATLGGVGIDELVDALQAALENAPCPVFVSGPDDTGQARSGRSG